MAENTEIVNKLQEDLNTALREKDAIVMRFAISEKNFYSQKVVNERLEKQLNQVLKEIDSFKTKTGITTATNAKETVSLSSSSLLSTNATDIANSFESHIAEIKANLILKTHQKETLEAKTKKLLEEFEISQSNYNKLVEESSALRSNLRYLENERDNLLEEIQHIRTKLDESAAKLNEIPALKNRISEQECINSGLTEEIERLKSTNKCLCEQNLELKTKEKEHVEFLQNVINENCHFKVNYNFFISTLHQKSCQLRSLRNLLNEKDEQLTSIKNELIENYDNLKKCNDVLKAKLEDLEALNQEANLKLEQQTDKNNVLEHRLKLLESERNRNKTTVELKKDDDFVMKLTRNEPGLDKSLIKMIGKLQTISIEKSEKIDYLEDQVEILKERLRKFNGNSSRKTK